MTSLAAFFFAAAASASDVDIRTGDMVCRTENAAKTLVTAINEQRTEELSWLVPGACAHPVTDLESQAIVAANRDYVTVAVRSRSGKRYRYVLDQALVSELTKMRAELLRADAVQQQQLLNAGSAHAGSAAQSENNSTFRLVNALRH